MQRDRLLYAPLDRRQRYPLRCTFPSIFVRKRGARAFVWTDLLRKRLPAILPGGVRIVQSDDVLVGLQNIQPFILECFGACCTGYDVLRVPVGVERHHIKLPLGHQDRHVRITQQMRAEKRQRTPDTDPVLFAL